MPANFIQAEPQQVRRLANFADGALPSVPLQVWDSWKVTQNIGVTAVAFDTSIVSTGGSYSAAYVFVADTPNDTRPSAVQLLAVHSTQPSSGAAAPYTPANKNSVIYFPTPLLVPSAKHICIGTTRGNAADLVYFEALVFWQYAYQQAK